MTDHTDDLTTHFSSSAHWNAVDVIELDVATTLVGFDDIVDVVLLDISTMGVIFHNYLPTPNTTFSIH